LPAPFTFPADQGRLEILRGNHPRPPPCQAGLCSCLLLTITGELDTEEEEEAAELEEMEEVAEEEEGEEENVAG